MKINFKPLLYFGPGLDDAGSAAAGGGTPYGSIAQGVTGLVQTIGGYIQQRRANKELNKLQSPKYTPNQSIMDYYNKALSRYNTSPYDSSLYKQQQKNIQRGMATGLAGLQDRRSALMGITKLVQAGNDATLNAGVQAENQQNQRFGQLGQATGMKAGEERTAFDINQYQPFERKYNLLAMKAGGGAQVMNAGLSNLYGSGQSLSQRNMINQYYGQ